jgi:hypothetical protein
VAGDDFMMLVRSVFDGDFVEVGMMDKTSCTKPLRGFGGCL